MASLKAESDLQIQKMKTDFEMKIKSIKSQLDEKAELNTKVKEDFVEKKEELEPSIEEAQNNNNKICKISDSVPSSSSWPTLMFLLLTVVVATIKIAPAAVTQESKGKVQSKETELKQLRKPKCDKD